MLDSTLTKRWVQLGEGDDATDHVVQSVQATDRAVKQNHLSDRAETKLPGVQATRVATSRLLRTEYPLETPQGQVEPPDWNGLLSVCYAPEEPVRSTLDPGETPGVLFTLAKDRSRCPTVRGSNAWSPAESEESSIEEFDRSRMQSLDWVASLICDGAEC